MATVTRTFEISVEAAAELDRLASLEQRAASHVINDLLLTIDTSSSPEFTPEQFEQIRQGLADAEAGRFVCNEDVESLLSKYRVHV